MPVWKVRMNKKHSGLEEGATIEIIIKGSQRKPSVDEVTKGFKEKYNIKGNVGSVTSTYDITPM